MEWTLLAAAAMLFAAAVAVLLIVLLRQSRLQGGGSDARLEDLNQRMSELARLFHTPHTRGVIGETMLGELLRSWLPEGHFELQYSFQSGTRADAVVRLGDSLVAVDAKFPMEAVSRAMDSSSSGGKSQLAEARKAILHHADAIAERYIRPAEGTVDFALLYLPSEALYHFLFVEQNPRLFEELGTRRVIPVSPGTLFLYIQTMLFSLSGAALPADRQELAQRLEGLRSELHDFATLFYRAGSHLRNATKNFEEAETQLSQIERRLSSLLGRRRA